ncbi:hypothetical protein KI387_030846, partial [Taxus chinensis]
FLHSGGVRGGNDYSDEFIGSSNGSLEKLDLEFQELLRERMSPTSLPQLYSERFGKPLQAEMRTIRGIRFSTIWEVFASMSRSSGPVAGDSTAMLR